MSNQQTTYTTLGRLAAAAVAVGLGVVGLGSPAAADRPVEFTDSGTFTADNPCTDEEHDITINVEVREHVHANGNVVVQIARTGTTSDGYVMEHGRETIVFNGNVARTVFTDTWRNDDGSTFKAQGVFIEKEDGMVVDRFRLRCLTR